MPLQNMLDNVKDRVDLVFKKSDEQEPSMEEPDRVNIMLAGKTGVGKSTLINAIFGEDIAATGIGEPVTQTINIYHKDNIPLRIYDVKGLELDAHVQKDIQSNLKKLIRASRKTEDKNDDIHLLWYCIASVGVRVEPLELEFIRDLAKQIDIVIVITKSFDGHETRELMAYLQSQKDAGGLPVKAIVPILAEDRTIDGAVVKEGFGLKELSELSYELLPDAQKRAFAGAQKVSAEVRKKAAAQVIALATAGAGAAGVIPIPIADALVLVPIQMMMLTGIANAYGLKFKEDDFTALVSAIAPLAMQAGGKAAVTSLLKLVPGVGVAAAAISGAVAAGFTAALGIAFQTALEQKVNELVLDQKFSDEFITIMMQIFHKKINEIDANKA
ncbi:MAG: DUF697 domain-containing protein [Propionibacteriaceae bacterium]|nr:DUF697 domain-containing protein [Propionibacteriaceae bacterium]